MDPILGPRICSILGPRRSQIEVKRHTERGPKRRLCRIALERRSSNGTGSSIGNFPCLPPKSARQRVAHDLPEDKVVELTGPSAGNASEEALYCSTKSWLGTAQPRLSFCLRTHCAKRNPRENCSAVFLTVCGKDKSSASAHAGNTLTSVSKKNVFKHCYKVLTLHSFRQWRAASLLALQPFSGG